MKSIAFVIPWGGAISQYITNYGWSHVEEIRAWISLFLQMTVRNTIIQTM